MKKIIVLLLMFNAMAVFASDARTEGLGGFAPIFIDDSQIFLNPALAYKFPNFATLELGRYVAGATTQQSGYGVLRANDYIYIGAGVLREKDDFDNISYDDLIGLHTPTNDFDAMVSLLLGRISIGFGTHLAGWKHYTKSTDTTSTTEHTQKTSVMAFTLGTALESEDLLIDAAFEMRMNSYLNEQVEDDDHMTSKIDGGLGLSFNSRAFLPLGGFKLVPAIGFNMFGYTPILEYQDSTEKGAKHSLMMISTTVGANIPVFGEGWVAPGVGFMYGSEKQESDDETNTQTGIVFPQVSLSGEVPLTKWADARFGYRRWFGSLKQEDKTDNTTQTSTIPINEQTQFMPPDQISVGLGIKLADGKITIDGTIGEQFIHEGGYIISGIEDNLFGTASLCVNF